MKFALAVKLSLRNGGRLNRSSAPSGRRKRRTIWALRLRVALSQESTNTARQKLARGQVRWENTFRPLILQITAGFASTVALLGGVSLLIGMFGTEPLLARDEPLGKATSPRFLYTSPEPAEGVADAATRLWCKPT